MSSRTAWGYVFEGDQPIEEIRAALNAGPWVWQRRESTWFGDYLDCTPGSGVRVRIHDTAQVTEATFMGAGSGRHDDVRELEEMINAQAEGRPRQNREVTASTGQYRATLEIEPGGAADRAGIDGVFRGLLDRIGAPGIAETDPFD